MGLENFTSGGGDNDDDEQESSASSSSSSSSDTTCTSVVSTRLGKMNKEMVMLAAGTTSKKRAMEFINSKFNEDVSGNTNVYISYMLDCLFGRDLAQADEQFRAGELVNRDDIARRVIQPKMLRLALERDNEE